VGRVASREQLLACGPLLHPPLAWSPVRARAYAAVRPPLSLWFTRVRKRLTPWFTSGRVCLSQSGDAMARAASLEAGVRRCGTLSLPGREVARARARDQ
jgi:hypothetical protein